MTDGIAIVVHAVPMDPEATTYTIECSECGVVAPATAQEVHDLSVGHLQEHGVDTSPYDLPEVPD